MANYGIADIKALRERTGAGMADVKKALDEADGNQDEAIDILRKKGLKGVAKRADRSASEGLAITHVADGAAGQVGTLVEINSETDFVAKNEKFISLANTVLEAVVAAGAADLESGLAADAGGQTVGDLIDAEAGILGEKIQLRRVARIEAPVVASYEHKTSQDLPPQIGVLVGATAEAGDVARDVAMHIAVYDPEYLVRDEVPADVVEHERTVAREIAVGEGKPEQALPKIVEGRLNGFFKERVLLEQAFAKDAKQSVGKVVEATGGEVTGFARFRVGA